MKTLANAIIVLCAWVMIGCDDTTSGDGGVQLDITRAEWSAYVVESFGYVDLALRGTTSGARVSVLSHGDGEDTMVCLDIADDGSFEDTIGIAFTHDPDTDPGNYSTEITAYSETGPSIQVVGWCVGSGETKTIELESGDLTFRFE